MLTEAILFTFLHSLWLGIMIVGIARLGISFIKRTNANLRYNFLILCLLTFVVATSSVFYLQLQEAVPFPDSLQGEETVLPSADKLTQASFKDAPPISSTPTNSEFLGELTNWFSRHASIIMMIWFIGVCIKGFFFSIDLGRIYYTRRKNISSVSAYWEDWIAQKSKALSIRRKVMLAQSKLTKAPITFGYFKPMILVPLGILSSFPPEQIESILYHELAHIKRRDFLTNIIQSILEIVFFFNPGLVWLSNLIRIEREHCCDDFAIQHINSKTDYVKALVSCAELNYNNTGLILNFVEDDHQLLNRVNRILAKKNSASYSFQNTLLSLGIICVLSSTFFMLETSDKTFFNNNLSITETVLSENKNSQKPKRRRITAITTDDITAVDTINIEATLAAIAQDIIQDKIVFSKRRLTYKLDQDIFIVNNVKQANAIHIKYRNKYIKAPDWIIQHMYPITIAADEEYQMMTGLSGSNIPLEDRKKIQGDLQAMINSMINDQLIISAKGVSFMLNNKTLIINGKTQSDSIFNKYKDRFLRRPAYVYSYNYKIKI